MEENRCITVVELGKMLHLSKTKAYEVVNQADFYPAFRVGKRVLVSLSALDRWLEERTVRPQEED